LGKVPGNNIPSSMEESSQEAKGREKLENSEIRSTITAEMVFLIKWNTATLKNIEKREGDITITW